MLTLENSPGLAELLMNENAEGARDEQFVTWAQDALEAGHDSPALLRLAVQDPPFFRPDLRKLFLATSYELGIEHVSFEQARIFYAQEIARRLQSSAGTPQQ